MAARRYLYLSLAVLLFLAGMGGVRAEEAKERIARKDEAIAGSLLKLEVNPWPYIGLKIYTVGYLDHLLYIYPTKAFAPVSNLYGIRVDDTDDGAIARSGCLGQYVALEGVVKREKDNAGRVYIDDVTALRFLDRHDCKVDLAH